MSDPAHCRRISLVISGLKRPIFLGFCREHVAKRAESGKPGKRTCDNSKSRSCVQGNTVTLNLS